MSTTNGVAPDAIKQFTIVIDSDVLPLVITTGSVASGRVNYADAKPL